MDWDTINLLIPEFLGLMVGAYLLGFVAGFMWRVFKLFSDPSDDAND